MAAALFLFAVVYICDIALAQRDAYVELSAYAEEYRLPDLPYPYNGLEPFLDEATLKVHHLGHHKAYAGKMNKALRKWREKAPDSELAHSSIIEILQRISEVPPEWQRAIKNNGGGFVNHVLYWSTMCPDAPPQPQGQLLADIEAWFGNFSAFKDQFSQAAAQLFGSGYVWLCEDEDKRLNITSTQNQDSPLSSGLHPLLVLDIWEHAYYLKHQNKRSGYITDWWEVVCWGEVQALRLFWRATDGPGDFHAEL